MERRNLILPKLGVLALLVMLPTQGAAQDEARLRRALEGKRITLQIDMPATSHGVDVYPGTSRPLDFGKYAGRLKGAGTAYKQGENAIITKVRVKDDNIEIQLGGGGFGTFGDELGGLFSSKGADGGTAQQAKIANDRVQALAAGSRFNLRFHNGVTPEDMTPEAVTQALQDYAVFIGTAPKALIADAAKTGPAYPGASTAEAQPQKGMTAEDMEHRWGKPWSSTTNGQITTSAYSLSSGDVEVDYFNGIAVDVRKHEPASVGSIRKGMSVGDIELKAGKPLSSTINGQVTTNKYRWQDGILEADFFNGVLVGYRIVSS